MHLSKIAGPFALALALAAAAGCATETPEDTGGVESDITGSIQAARITRIKEAYTAAGVEAFTPIQPMLTDEQIAAWNFDAQDPHWFSFLVDGRTVLLVDFLADASVLLDGAPVSPANPRESFVLFFDVGADQATYGTVLLYSADRDQWVGLKRALRDTKTTVTDGGIPVMTDGGSHSADGTSSYYAACLTELANGQLTKVFSFWATVEPRGDSISLTLEALSLSENQPPPTVTRAGIVGGKLPVIAGAKDAVQSFLGVVPPGTTARFPGASNPISGSDVVLSNPGLRGRFAKDRFCARLVGRVEQPTTAARDLDVDKNFCIFVPIKDGDRTPAFTFGEYSVANCPL